MGKFYLISYANFNFTSSSIDNLVLAIFKKQKSYEYCRLLT